MLYRFNHIRPNLAAVSAFIEAFHSTMPETLNHGINVKRHLSVVNRNIILCASAFNEFLGSLAPWQQSTCFARVSKLYQNPCLLKELGVARERRAGSPSC